MPMPDDGYDRDPLKWEHENGDRDGLGFSRGCLSALALVLIPVAMWLVADILHRMRESVDKEYSCGSCGRGPMPTSYDAPN